MCTTNVTICALIFGVAHPHFRLDKEDNSKCKTCQYKWCHILDESLTAAWLLSTESVPYYYCKEKTNLTNTSYHFKIYDNYLPCLLKQYLSGLSYKSFICLLTYSLILGLHRKQFAFPSSCYQLLASIRMHSCYTS